MGFVLEQLAHVVSLQLKNTEEIARLAKVADRTDRRLDRAIRLAVQEARAERVRRQELDARVAEENRRLKEGQEKLQTNLDAFIESMRRGGNGSH
jgi:hypothetical protein